MTKEINGRIGNLGNKETLSQNLKRLLATRGLNPHQFAEIMNFKYTTVMNWMKANTYPRIDKIELMARYFGVDKSDLVEEYVETSSTLSEINRISSSLDEKRQENVLKFSKNQLQEQNQEIEKEKVIALDKKNSNNTDIDDDGIDWNEWVAFDGKPMTDHDKQVLKDYFGDELKD